MNLDEHGLIIRTDANSEIGIGHLMRCLALGQGWKDKKGAVTFLTSCQNQSLLKHLELEEFRIIPLEHIHPHAEDLKTTLNILSQHPNAWLALDGYHFDSNYQQQIKKAGHPLLVVDDMGHLKHYWADILVNQNIYAHQLNYSCQSDTRLLLGTQYTLLRREFLTWKTWHRKIPSMAKHILLTSGGADPHNLNSKLINALHDLSESHLQIRMIVGPENPQLKKLEETIKQLNLPIHLMSYDVNMPESMAWADVAISASGSTVWELAFMGVPTVVIVTAENQQPIAKELDTQNIFKNLGWANQLSSEEIAKTLKFIIQNASLRSKMSESARNLVDGMGSDRILSHCEIDILKKKFKLHLRPVTKQDARFLWEWANDPVIRETSFSSKPISWEEHIQWFEKNIKDPTCYYYLFVNEQNDVVGQTRFNIKNGEAEISVSISQKYRGRGYGAIIIQIGCSQLFNKVKKLNEILALIRPENINSIRAFQKSGFIFREKTTRKGQDAHLMTLHRV